MIKGAIVTLCECKKMHNREDMTQEPEVLMLEKYFDRKVSLETVSRSSDTEQILHLILAKRPRRLPLSPEVPEIGKKIVAFIRSASKVFTNFSNPLLSEDL